MSKLRADLWSAAFVRRHNDAGRICVVSRRGDPVAGQIWIEIDHLDGTRTLYTPAPGVMVADTADWVFQCRFERAPAEEVSARIARESDWDPDFWVVTLESHSDDAGLNVVNG